MFGDPFAMSSKMVEQMEALFIERMKEMLGSPSFLSSISRNVESGLEGKKEFDSALKKHMESLNIPTRDDIAKILIYLQRIESKVADMEESVEDLSDELKAIKQESPLRPVRKAAAKESPADDTGEAEKGRKPRASAGRGKPQKSPYYGKERGTGTPYRGDRGTGSSYRGEKSAGSSYRGEKSAGSSYRGEKSAGSSYRGEKSAGSSYRGEKSSGPPHRGERSAPRKTGGRKKR
ncbi:MAG: hypothetical protein AB2L14_02565 [Candidatus Xenobiia bacterium LiM19]